MISIKILGSGCANCDRLERHSAQAAERWCQENPGVEVTLEKVTDSEKFLDYGLLTTPGLVINERLVSSGKIPVPSQIVTWLDAAAAP